MIKKSFMRKIAVGVMALMIAGTVGTTVNATGYQGAPETGSITVHKYSKVTSSGNLNLTGEAIENTDGLGTPLQGVGFTLYSLVMPPAPAGETYTDEYEVNKDVDGVITDVTINFTNGDTGTATVTVPGMEAFTDVNGVIEFGAEATLAKGHYLLVESSPLEGYKISDPAIISLPLTNATGDGYISEVHVYPKNISELSITKVLDDTGKTYVAGDQISFTIDAAFSNTAAEPDTVTSVADLKEGTARGEMAIDDKLVSGLSYVSSTVYALYPDGSREQLEAGVDYELSRYDTPQGLEQGLTWSLTETGIDKVVEKSAEALQVMVVAEVAASNQALTNMASSMVVKANATGDPTFNETPDVVVPTGTIYIDKVDSESAALAGAVFAIANNADGTTFLKKDGSGTIELTNYAALVAAKDELLLATTDETGKAVLSGLLCSEEAITSYRLVEIQSPVGYQLKEAPITADLLAVVDASIGSQTSVTVTNYANGTVDPDNPKFSLPLTGGTGTILFTIIGLLIMGTTVMLYKRVKKNSNA